MAAKTGTYSLIASNTLGSAAASVTFSSISATYTDLVLIANMSQTSGAQDFSIRFNGDTGNNYSRTVLHGSGSAAGSDRSSNASLMSLSYYAYPPSAASTFGAEIIQILDYSNTTTYKTVLARANSASTGTDATVGLWRNTAAINEVIVIMNSGTIATGSTFKLYGIEAGNL